MCLYMYLCVCMCACVSQIEMLCGRRPHDFLAGDRCVIVITGCRRHCHLFCSDSIKIFHKNWNASSKFSLTRTHAHSQNKIEQSRAYIIILKEHDLYFTIIECINFIIAKWKLLRIVSYKRRIDTINVRYWRFHLVQSVRVSNQYILPAFFISQPESTIFSRCLRIFVLFYVQK